MRKADKRRMAEQRRAEFEESVKLSGLSAQRRGREEESAKRARLNRSATAEAARLNSIVETHLRFQTADEQRDPGSLDV